MLPLPWSTVDQAVVYILMFVTGGLGIVSGSALTGRQ
jgi:hypothetical protein